MMTSIRSLIVRALAVLVALGGMGLADVRAFPARGISDAGDFFDGSHEQQAIRRIEELHSKFKKDVRVETFAKVPDDHADRLKQLGADAFFKDWLKELAKTEHVDGVFVLICRQPAMIKVGINESTRKSLFTESDREALWKLMKRRFDQKDFDAGLMAGIDYIQDRFAAHSSGNPLAQTDRLPSSSPARPHPLPNGRVPDQPQGIGLGSILLFAAVVFVGFLLLRGLFRAFTGGATGGGYGTGYPAGGGGWGSSFLSGLFGAAVGNMLYDSFFRGHSSPFGTSSGWDNSASAAEPRNSLDSGGSSQEDWSVNDGGSFGDSSSGDFGGGDFGGGDFGGGGSDY